MPPTGGNGIGTVLDHLALIGAGDRSAGVRELPEQDCPAEAAAHLPYPDRADGGGPSAGAGPDLDWHLARPDAVRERLLATFAAMTADNVRRPRAVAGSTTAPESTPHHPMRHGAEHRGRIATLRDRFERSGV